MAIMESIGIGTAIIGLAKDINNVNNKMEIATKTNEIIELAGNANMKIVELTASMMELQQRNKDLEEEIEKSTNWNERINNYELVKTEGNAIVFRFKEKPEHFACPPCIEEKRITILQEIRGRHGHFECTKCNVKYSIKPYKKMAPIKPMNFDNPW